MTIPHIRVLVVEDNPGDADLVAERLHEVKGARFETVREETLAGGVDRASSEPFDVILLDLGLSDSQGFDTFARMQQASDHVPIVVFTGLDDENLCLEAVRKGAQDYMIKNQLSGPLLARALRYAIERKRITTALRASEEQVRRLNAELEQRVQERTAALEAAVQELESFAYSVSHDLRSPLRAIDGFAQILLTEYAEALPEQPRHYLRLVSDNVRQMGRLVDDLLRFARINRQSVHWETIAPADLVRRCLEELQAEREGRQVEIEVGTLPECYADSRLLRDVWLNLLHNALKFTRTRTPARIEVGSTTRNGDTVYFVRDNGVGFDMRYAGKLFGVFQRLHRMEEYEGTGIGLALVQRILQRHDGRIWVEAVPDQGATFYFTLGKRGA